MTGYNLRKAIIALILIVCFLTPLIQECSIQYYAYENTQIGFYQLFPSPYFGILFFWKAYNLVLMSFGYGIYCLTLRIYEDINRYVVRGEMYEYDPYTYERSHRDLIQYFNRLISLKFPDNNELSIHWIYDKDGKK